MRRDEAKSVMVGSRLVETRLVESMGKWIVWESIRSTREISV
jgi:hypothetical protein